MVPDCRKMRGRLGGGGGAPRTTRGRSPGAPMTGAPMTGALSANLGAQGVGGLRIGAVVPIILST